MTIPTPLRPPSHSAASETGSTFRSTCWAPLLVAGLALAGARGSAPQEPGAASASAGPLSAEEVALQAAFLEQGIGFEPREGWITLPVEVAVRDGLLEYLLVGPAGATHESLFTTSVPASAVQTGLLALGLTPGTNASWSERDPQPTEEELRAGASPWIVQPPSGDAVRLYVAWSEGGEVYFYAVEDVLRDLFTGRSMRRHAWTFLGSRMVPNVGRREASAPDELLAADVYQNLICISFFANGYTLLTASLPECVEQKNWLANAWLLPDRGATLSLVVSREPLASLPAGLRGRLPEVAPPAPLGEGALEAEDR